jgi:hypothetical protein
MMRLTLSGETARRYLRVCLTRFFGVFYYITFCPIPPMYVFCVICLCYALACSVHKKAIDSPCLNFPTEDAQSERTVCTFSLSGFARLRKLVHSHYYTHVSFLSPHRQGRVISFGMSVPEVPYARISLSALLPPFPSPHVRLHRALHHRLPRLAVACPPAGADGDPHRGTGVP